MFLVFTCVFLRIVHLPSVPCDQVSVSVITVDRTMDVGLDLGLALNADGLVLNQAFNVFVLNTLC